MTGDDATLADIGEFGLIVRVSAILAGRGSWRADELGPGDDAAVVSLGDDPRAVATTDMLVEGRHFRRDWSSAYDIGRKAAAQSLADIEAMGARPVTLLVAFGAPGTTTVAFAEDLARGLADEGAMAGASVAGGDTVSADRVTVSVTALGSLDGRTPVTRAGARPGDVIAVVGSGLGWAQAGLTMLRRGDGALVDKYAELVGRHRCPRPPYTWGRRLAAAGASALVDTSDGLFADLGHVLAASGVGARLDATADELPGWQGLVAAAAELGVAESGWQLTGGEDHTLVVTMPEQHWESLVGAAGDTGSVELCRLGEVVAEPGLIADYLEPPGVGGFDHFGPSS